MVDYSKWDHIELSDDDAEDCHPNIEKNTWMRLKREQREMKKREEQERHEANVASQVQLRSQTAQLEAKLQGDGPAAAHAQLHAQLEEARKKEAQVTKLLQEEEERKKKFVKWDKDSICHDGFSKTIVNKGSTTAPSPAAPSASASAVVTPPEERPKEAVPAASVVLTENKNMSEDELNEYVREMEVKAHKFAACKDYDEYYEYLRAHPELLVKETNDYLLLHVSDFIKKSQWDRSKKYCIAACLVQYSLELGPQGAQILFHRLRDPNPSKNYRQDFETETMAYWERIKVKILELQAQRAARKAAGLPEDPSEQGEEPGEDVPADAAVEVISEHEGTTDTVD